jgi:hypothetical protein
VKVPVGGCQAAVVQLPRIVNARDEINLNCRASVCPAQKSTIVHTFRASGSNSIGLFPVLIEVCAGRLN